MEIDRSGSQPSGKGQAEYFTGTVRIDPLFDAPDPARCLGASVTFEPGARTSLARPSVGPDPDRDGGLWSGATLGRPDRGNSAGGCDLISPGEKHWHGATPTTAMTHFAIIEKIAENSTGWMELVNDEQYTAGVKVE